MTEITLGTALSQPQRDNLNMVKVSAESLLTIINDILDFSKIEAGKLAIAEEDFDLREFARWHRAFARGTRRAEGAFLVVRRGEQYSTFYPCRPGAGRADRRESNR